MSIQFATCDRRRALGFLKKLYPSCDIQDAPDSAGPVLDFVARDIIRIGDPDFHNGQVFASKGTPSEIDHAIAEMKKFHAHAMDQKARATDTSTGAA